MFHVFAFTYYNLLRCVTHEYSMTSLLEQYMKHVFVAGLVTGDFFFIFEIYYNFFQDLFIFECFDFFWFQNKWDTLYINILTLLEQASSFLSIGIDFTGPVNIKTGNSVQKVYVVIFACLVTGVIHLEIARDTTAAEFLRTFIRFSSIRGCPKFVITDNASNFFDIQPMVSDKVNITDRGILNYSSVNEMRWKFIPQYSPWQGGTYEWLIGIVKSCLRKSYY